MNIQLYVRIRPLLNRLSRFSTTCHSTIIDVQYLNLSVTLNSSSASSAVHSAQILVCLIRSPQDFAHHADALLFALLRTNLYVPAIATSHLYNTTPITTSNITTSHYIYFSTTFYFGPCFANTRLPSPPTVCKDLQTAFTSDQQVKSIFDIK